MRLSEHVPSIFELIVSIEDPPKAPGARIIAIPLAAILLGFLLYASGVFNASILFLAITMLLRNILHIAKRMHLWNDPSKEKPIQQEFLAGVSAITGLIGVALLLEFLIPIAYHFLT